MLGRLRNLFGGKPAMIMGTGKLPEGEAKTVDLGDPLAGGKQVVLCRLEGELYALDSMCPHEGGRITGGPLAEGRWAVCPLHNYHFDPRTGEARGGICRKAKAYKLRETDGNSEVWI